MILYLKLIIKNIGLVTRMIPILVGVHQFGTSIRSLFENNY